MITLILYVLFFASLCSRHHAWTAKSIVRKFLLLVAYSATVDIMTAKPGIVQIAEWADKRSPVHKDYSSADKAVHFTHRFVSEDFNRHQHTPTALVPSNYTQRGRRADSIGGILVQKYFALVKKEKPKRAGERRCVLRYCIPPSTIGA